MAVQLESISLHIYFTLHLDLCIDVLIQIGPGPASMFQELDMRPPDPDIRLCISTSTTAFICLYTVVK